MSVHVHTNSAQILFDLGTIARWLHLIKLQIGINLQWYSCHNKQLLFLPYLFIYAWCSAELDFRTCFRTVFQYTFLTSLESHIPKNRR